PEESAKQRHGTRQQTLAQKRPIILGQVKWSQWTSARCIGDQKDQEQQMTVDPAWNAFGATNQVTFVGTVQTASQGASD
ncbi:hypothetical protein DFQ28_007061, partial [Apophysomyces sp. BC1034]